VTYKLKLPKQWQIHLVFHTNLLTPYYENKVYRPNYIAPAPDILNGQEEWEVEAILGHKGMNNRRRYLIHWKGYSPADNTWEPAWNLSNAQELLDDYKKAHKL
jgi:hypothetical protein